MSSLLTKPRPINPAAAEPLRLTEAEATELHRVGYLGDAAVPGRIAGVLTPEELEDYADMMEIAYAARTGRNEAPGYSHGLLLSRYRSLHRIYTETLERLEATRAEYFLDRLPELPPAAYYDPGDDDDLAGATVDQETGGYNS